MDKEIKFKEFRLEATINAPVEKLVAAMNDIENYTEWMSDLKSVELVKQVSDEELITYSVIEVPFPFDNRDIVTVYNFSGNKNNGIVRIDMESMNDLLPEEEGLIRITIARGFWEFTPLSAEQTSIIYQFVADPGGSIPAWLTNMFLIEGPMKTVENLNEFLLDFKGE